MELQHNAIAVPPAAGATHVVKLSAFAASDHSNAPIGRWRYQVEKELQASGWLRPCSGLRFIQNLLAQAGSVIKESAIYWPSGDGKIPYIDANDIAAVTFVSHFAQPGHQGKKYVLTGSEAISYRQAAEIIGEVIGKKVRCSRRVSRGNAGTPRSRRRPARRHRKQFRYWCL